jgi:hypothetical protein
MPVCSLRDMEAPRNAGVLFGPLSPLSSWQPVSSPALLPSRNHLLSRRMTPKTFCLLAEPWREWLFCNHSRRAGAGMQRLNPMGSNLQVSATPSGCQYRPSRQTVNIVWPAGSSRLQNLQLMAWPGLSTLMYYTHTKPRLICNRYP